MRVHLKYGKSGLDVEIPSSHVNVIRPRFIRGLADEHGSFIDCVRHPLSSLPLKRIITGIDKVAIVIPDITRPMPSQRILPWLFEELSHVPKGNFTIINGTGSHRANTPEEMEGMIGREIAQRYRIVNHNAYESNALAHAGNREGGHPVLMNKEYVLADKRIVIGFIEPHFFAGYSGGYKGVFPAVADIESILHYHAASIIGDERSNWGVLDGNPTQELIRTYGALLRVDFCINVTLNSKHEITGFFCGEVMDVHTKGCAFVESTAMIKCVQPFKIVITTNGGYPLDQNLYQTVKGISAAAQITAPNGVIIAASECSEGFPDHGNFKKLLFDYASAGELLDAIQAPGFSMHDQWEAQKLAMILLHARTALFSSMPYEDVTNAHLEYVDDMTSFISRELERTGKDEPIAVLPEGPMTIPHL